jgi:hypothetical protein
LPLSKAASRWAMSSVLPVDVAKKIVSVMAL